MTEGRQTSPDLVFPEAWGYLSEPLPRAEFEQLKGNLEAEVLSGPPYRGAGTYRLVVFPQQAPFIRQAVRELIEEDKISQNVNGLLEPR